jgi:hypothetical protein
VESTGVMVRGCSLAGGGCGWGSDTALVSEGLLVCYVLRGVGCTTLPQGRLSCVSKNNLEARGDNIWRVDDREWVH